MTQQEKAAAERERKARIKRAQAHLADLPADERQHLVETASEKELAARDAGIRRASVAFLEDALVAWSIGGTLMAAHGQGVVLTREQVDEVVRAASDRYRGNSEGIDTLPEAFAALEFRPPAQRKRARAALPDQKQPTAAAAVTVPADATPEQLGQAANDVAEKLVADLKTKAVALRGQGLTVAEVATRLHVNPRLAADLCGEAPRGKAKAPAAARVRAAQRPVRGHVGDGASRQEQCPGCGEWRPAQVDAAGAYLKESDFRPGRGDCRACYNRRWLEGKKRREAERAGK